MCLYQFLAAVLTEIHPKLVVDTAGRTCGYERLAATLAELRIFWISKFASLTYHLIFERGIKMWVDPWQSILGDGDAA
jgi:hypothetical protein